jgi:hypothetical protein
VDVVFRRVVGTETGSIRKRNVIKEMNAGRRK